MNNMGPENIFDKIQEMFGYVPTNLNILEEQIDIDLQMEYFELSKNYTPKLSNDEIINRKALLFEKKTSHEDKKSLFVQLASIDNIEAYRTIEKYLETPDKRLRDWAVLALQESRMLLESKLLDENQVFISTGLGGKGAKLRYFVVIISKNDTPFTNVQKKIIQSEFDYVLTKHQAELEEVNFSEKFATLLTVVPLHIVLQDIFKDAIAECNQYGDFLQSNFIVTNVKTLSFDEIDTFLKKQDSNGGQEDLE